MLEQVLHLPRVVRVQRDADTGRHEGLLCAQLERRLQRMQDLLGDAFHAADKVQIRQDHRELVPAQARHRVGLAHAGSDAARGVDQQNVALLVSERVVDLLEVVQVDEQDRDVQLIALGLGDVVRQPVMEHAPVGQLGQRVEVGLLPDQHFRLLLLGHVLDHAKMQRRASGVDGGNRHVDPHDRAVRTQQALGRLEAGTAPRRQLVHARHFARHIVRVDDVGPLAALDLVEAAARDFGVTRVDVLALAAHRVDQGDAHRRFLEHGAKPQFALADSLVGAAPLARQQRHVHRATANEQQRGRGQHPVQPGQGIGTGIGVVQEAVEGDPARQHAQVGVDVGDVAPAFRIHVADFNQHRLHQRHHLARFEQQMLAVVAAGVLGQDQVGHFFGMGHGIGPAFHAGGAKGLDPLGMARDLVFAGEQIVAVKIDAGRARAVHVVLEADAVEVIGFIGRIRREGVDPALDQVVDVVSVLDPNQAADGHPFLLEVGGQLVGLGQLFGERADHDALAFDLADVGRGVFLAHQQHVGRMLEHHAQHHQRLAGHARQQRAGAAGAIFGRAVDHAALWLAAILAFVDLHFQPGVAVIAFFNGRVIAGKLELVGVLELQAHLLERLGRAGGQTGEQQPRGARAGSEFDAKESRNA